MSQLSLFESQNPEESIHELNKKGYEWLVDLGAGKHDLEAPLDFYPILHFNHEIIGKGKSDFGFIETPYIPYRIKFPSGKILDEREIFQEMGTLEKIGFSRKEIADARTLYRAIHDENFNLVEKYKFSGTTFIDEKDMKNSIEKYTKNPFW